MTLLQLASILTLLVTLSYGLVCAVQPFGRCRKCDGFGFKVKHTRRGKPRRGRDCRRCHGHGIRIRRGRHAWNLARRLHRQGTADTPTTTTAPAVTPTARRTR